MNTAALAGHHPRLRWKSLQPRMPDYDDPGFGAARCAWLAWWEFGQAMGYGAPGEPAGAVPAPIPHTPFEPPGPVTVNSLHAPLFPSGAAPVTNIALPPQWCNAGYQHFVRATGEWREFTPGLQVLLGEPCRNGEEAILHFRLTPEPVGNDPGPIETGR